MNYTCCFFRYHFNPVIVRRMFWLGDVRFYDVIISHNLAGLLPYTVFLLDLTQQDHIPTENIKFSVCYPTLSFLHCSH